MNMQTAVVPVYNFRVLDSGYESARVSGFKATRQAVLDVFGGDPIESTEEHVPREDLDELGRYRRVATGWGELA
jgi:hypothetical protein